MKIITFAKRNVKEILRDPLNLCFGLGFPIVLLFLLSLIQANIPIEIFDINTLTPGITVFGLSFMTLFSASLIAKDRESAFLQRLFTTPLKSIDFILGYLLPIIPISIMQAIICIVCAIPLGLNVNINIIYTIIGIIPISIFYVNMGLLFGSILEIKQVGGICGALLTNLSAWLSGIWFDVNHLGGFLKKIADILPFKHAVQMQISLINGNFKNVFSDYLVVAIYSIIIFVFAVFAFLRQMKSR